MTIETYEDVAGEHRCRIKASNGEILMQSSEGYKDKRDLYNMIELVCKELSAATVIAC